MLNSLLLVLSLYSPATVRVWVHTTPTSHYPVTVLMASNNWPTSKYMSTRVTKVNSHVTLLVNTNH